MISKKQLTEYKKLTEDKLYCGCNDERFCNFHDSDSDTFKRVEALKHLLKELELKG